MTHNDIDNAPGTVTCRKRRGRKEQFLAAGLTLADAVRHLTPAPGYVYEWRSFDSDACASIYTGIERHNCRMSG